MEADMCLVCHTIVGAQGRILHQMRIPVNMGEWSDWRMRRMNGVGFVAVTECRADTRNKLTTPRWGRGSEAAGDA